MEIKDNTFARQFETQHPNGRVYVEYALQERNLFLTRITTPEGFDDEDFIQVLIEKVLQEAEARNNKVVPTYPKVAAFIKKNPQFKTLLPPGIKL